MVVQVCQQHGMDLPPVSYRFQPCNILMVYLVNSEDPLQRYKIYNAEHLSQKLKADKWKPGDRVRSVETTFTIHIIWNSSCHGKLILHRMRWDSKAHGSEHLRAEMYVTTHIHCCYCIVSVIHKIPCLQKSRTSNGARS